MGCQAAVTLENNLTFSICTHDPDTGALTDADSAPTFRIYEDETETPIRTGTMAKLDDGNTTGFYTQQIACTASSGYEAGKSYTIYINATVDGDTGGISYAFTVETSVNAEVSDVLKVDTIAEMAQGKPTATPTFEEALMYLYMALRNKIDVTSALKEFHDDAGTVIWKKALSDDGTTYTEAEGATGP
jgi:hypothetical protein